MRDIFTELYKKVLGIFQTEEKEAEESKNVAVNRMKLVLMQDRTNLTPFLLEKMRGELIELLSKYVEMDKEMLELNFAQEGDSMALMLSIPVIRAREEEEINEILKSEEQAKAKEETQEVSEESEDVSEEEVSEEAEETNADTDEESGVSEVCLCGCQEGGECSCQDCDDIEIESEEDDSAEETESEEVDEGNKKDKK